MQYDIFLVVAAFGVLVAMAQEKTPAIPTPTIPPTPPAAGTPAPEGTPPLGRTPVRPLRLTPGAETTPTPPLSRTPAPGNDLDRDPGRTPTLTPAPVGPTSR